ncbi:MAG: NrsF family protein [Myxococcota bacterium]
MSGEPGVSGEPGESTDRLIRQLATDVPPVRRVPPLWMSFGGVIAVASAVGIVFLLASGAPSDVRSAVRGGGPYGAVLLGLGLAGLLGSLAALAEGIPGRERSVVVCGWAAIVAFGWGAGRALAAWWSEGFAPGVGLAVDRMCLQRALLLAVVPTLALVLLLARGWVGRPARAAVLALTAGAALGSVGVHLGCQLDEGRHLLVGHVGPTVVWVALIAAPLAFWLSRKAR